MFTLCFDHQNASKCTKNKFSQSKKGKHNTRFFFIDGYVMITTVQIIYKIFMQTKQVSRTKVIYIPQITELNVRRDNLSLFIHNL